MSKTVVYTCDRCNTEIQYKDMMEGPLNIMMSIGSVNVKLFPTRFIAHSNNLCHKCIEDLCGKLKVYLHNNI